jgi:mono/diheme cytochrome c family protein
MNAPLHKRAVILLFCGSGLLSGCKATPPAKWETSVITRVKHSLTVKGKDEKNPLPDTPVNVERGRVAFSYYCAACHGLDGQNTGVPFAERMSPPVPPLNARQVQSYADGQLNWIIENGISPSGMPGSKGILADHEIWSIVIYIRHLPEAGSLGEPKMYSGDDTSTLHSSPSAQVR